MQANLRWAFLVAIAASGLMACSSDTEPGAFFDVSTDSGGAGGETIGGSSDSDGPDAGGDAGTADTGTPIDGAPAGTLCRPCESASDCLTVDGEERVCVDYGDAGSFCGLACSTSEDCPSGYACSDTQTVAGAPTRQCIATAECACSADAITLASATGCAVQNEFGTCTGTRFCAEDGLTACDAATPAEEVCDGIDNDCDGETDESTCDDGNPCTTDVCGGADGCTSSPAEDGGECVDGDPCTVGDHCEDGTCAGAPLACDDGDPCTDDACEAGECTTTPNTAPCDDGEACTLGDQCQAGTCAGTPVTCECAVDADCAALEDGDLCNGTLRCNTDLVPARCEIEPETVVTCPELSDEDNHGCLAMACAPDTGLCGTVPTAEGKACDDGDACQVAETCVEGECQGGVALNCNDGNPCTVDACEAGACTHEPAEAPCNDGDACTLGDQCSDGNCAPGAAAECDDDNPCTTDACDPATGCTHVADNSAACDDNNACTTADHCAGGVCKSLGAVSCDDDNPCTTDSCEPASGCVHKNVAFTCSDGNACTEGDACVAGACTPGPAPDCDDDNPCTTDSCNPVSGCVHASNDAACSDGNACTTGDHCAGGACVIDGNLACDDGNPCTADGCDPVLGCVYENTSGPCVDGDACTEGDYCAGGDCVPGAMTNCDDDNPCTADSCDPTTGCINASDDTASCDDGNACTSGDHCDDGQCTPETTLNCDDGNPCTTDTCTLDGGCVHTPASGPCSDGDACTSVDTCQNGACVPGAALECDDNNPCTAATCDPAVGCVVSPTDAACSDNNACTVGDHCEAGACVITGTLQCDDGNPCTANTCSPVDGCTTAAIGGPCSDGDVCTQGDSCTSGECVPGGNLTCDDGNPCTTDGCDPTTGCTATPNAAACSDANACTLGDHCEAGACVSTGNLVCNDDNPCTADTCDPVDGCTYAAIVGPCNDGDVCTQGDSCVSGACVGGPVLGCDDGNPCTTDACDPAVGCTTTPNDGDCSDGNACTVGDACVAGSCQSTGVMSCNDDNPCTADACDPSQGCVYTPAVAACDDGDACTVGDQCDSGVCVSGTNFLCADGDVCTTDACDPATGCTFSPATGAPCDDGNACTSDDACVAGSCQGGQPTLCDDGDLCTVDSCSPVFGCLSEPDPSVCDSGNNEVCVNSACVCAEGYHLAGDGTTCTSDPCDPNPCEGGTLCLDGECTDYTAMSGVIEGDVAIDGDDGPWLATGPILVAEGATLTLGPGARIDFAPGTYLKVEGDLVAAGTEADPVVFSAQGQPCSAGDWQGIEFRPTATGSSLDYAVLECASTAAYVYRIGLQVTNSTFRKNSRAVELRYTFQASFQYSRFEDNSTGIYSAYQPSGDSYGPITDTLIYENVFEDNNTALELNMNQRHFAGLDIIGNEFTGGNVGLRFGGGGYGPYLHSMMVASNWFHDLGSWCMQIGGYYSYGTNGPIEGSAANSVAEYPANIYSNLLERCNGMSISSGNVKHRVANNLIIDTSSAPVTLGGNAGALVTGNQLLGGDGTISVRPATIFDANTVVGGTASPLIQANGTTLSSNNLIPGGALAMTVTSTTDVTALDNFWGVGDEADIPALLHDYYDNFELGKALFSPAQLAPHTDAPPLGPTNVTRSGSGTVTVTWTPSTSPQVGGYRVYIGSRTRTSFPSLYDVGNVTTFEAPFVGPDDVIVVTAHIAAVGSSPNSIYFGEESWFVEAVEAP